MIDLQYSAPTLAQDCIIDRGLTDTELFRKIALRYTRNSQFAKYNNRLFSQLRLPMFGTVLHPILNSHVGVVVCNSPNKKMRRVHARRVVAFMQHAHAVRNVSVADRPSDSMREICFSIRSEISVTCRATRSGPNPTRTKLKAVRRNRSFPIYFRPKSLSERRTRRPKRSVYGSFFTLTFVSARSTLRLPAVPRLWVSRKKLERCWLNDTTLTASLFSYGRLVHAGKFRVVRRPGRAQASRGALNGIA